MAISFVGIDLDRTFSPRRDAFATLRHRMDTRWRTAPRASRVQDEPPAVSADWEGALNSWGPCHMHPWVGGCSKKP